MLFGSVIEMALSRNVTFGNVFEQKIGLENSSVLEIFLRQKGPLNEAFSSKISYTWSIMQG